MGCVWLSEISCVELLGDERSQAFIKYFGGKCMYIPLKPHKDHRIAQAVGLIGMAVMCKEYGGLSVNIANSRWKDSKKSKIIELINSGLSLSKIATMMEVSCGYVSKIKREYIKA